MATNLIIVIVCIYHASSDSTGIFELKEMRRSIDSLIKLCSADREKVQDNIAILNQTKAAQARRLARVQTVEVGEVVTEQRLIMAE